VSQACQPAPGPKIKSADAKVPIFTPAIFPESLTSTYNIAPVKYATGIQNKLFKKHPGPSYWSFFFIAFIFLTAHFFNDYFNEKPYDLFGIFGFTKLK
jgi:hypothetical protein